MPNKVDPSRLQDDRGSADTVTATGAYAGVPSENGQQRTLRLA